MKQLWHSQCNSVKYALWFAPGSLECSAFTPGNPGNPSFFCFLFLIPLLCISLFFYKKNVISSLLSSSLALFLDVSFFYQFPHALFFFHFSVSSSIRSIVLGSMKMSPPLTTTMASWWRPWPPHGRLSPTFPKKKNPAHSRVANEESTNMPLFGRVHECKEYEH